MIWQYFLVFWNMFFSVKGLRDKNTFALVTVAFENVSQTFAHLCLADSLCQQFPRFCKGRHLPNVTMSAQCTNPGKM